MCAVYLGHKFSTSDSLHQVLGAFTCWRDPSKFLTKSKTVLTGITRPEYRKAVQNRSDIEWRCRGCFVYDVLPDFESTRIEDGKLCFRIRAFLQCYVILCYVLCYMLCYVMLCYVM